jgi:hypothetical protein
MKGWNLPTYSGLISTRSLVLVGISLRILYLNNKYYYCLCNKALSKCCSLSDNIFCLAVQPSSVPGHLVLRFIDHTRSGTLPVGLLWTRDQLVADAAKCTTHKKYNRRTFMASAKFEPAVLTMKRPQTFALDRTATDTGCHIKMGLWNCQSKRRDA